MSNTRNISLQGLRDFAAIRAKQNPNELVYVQSANTWLTSQWASWFTETEAGFDSYVESTYSHVSINGNQAFKVPLAYQDWNMTTGQRYPEWLWCELVEELDALIEQEKNS